MTKSIDKIRKGDKLWPGTIDYSTIPEFQRDEEGNKVPIYGVRTYHPGVFICRSLREDGSRCNTAIAILQKDYSRNFDGYKCPICGTVHKKENILELMSYRETAFVFWEYVNVNSMRKITVKYRTEATPIDGTKTYHIAIKTLTPEVAHHSFVDVLTSHAISYDHIRKILAEHGHEMDPMLVELVTMGLEDHEARYVVQNYYHKLHLARNLKNANPELFFDLMKALKGHDVSYEEFVSMYPPYLGDLTKKLLSSYNAYEDRNRSYGRPYIWQPDSAYTDKRNLNAVVESFKNDTINFSNMQRILEYPKAINNPTFYRAFKVYRNQMARYLVKMANEGKDLLHVDLDVPCYYVSKNYEYFRSCGYSDEQILETHDGSKEPLDSLVELSGKRRRKS